MSTETATLGGGCFWCLEAVFEQLRGVARVESGYSGGTVADPSYTQVCTGTTAHAEVVQVTFDPTVLSYRDLLRVFFTLHDPTTLNRQGPDSGTQYRSAVFFHSPKQKATAQEVIAEFNSAGVWGSPVVTEVVPFRSFYRAEDHHQGFYQQHKTNPYCRIVIAPKVAKLRKQFLEKLKAEYVEAKAPDPVTPSPIVNVAPPELNLRWATDTTYWCLGVAVALLGTAVILLLRRAVKGKAPA